MEFLGSVALQDDYSSTEDLCFNIIERFKCDACQVTNEFLKSMNKSVTDEDMCSDKTTSSLNILNKKSKK
ncbi:Uncharacterised protein [Candidatus Tiddalikarchaeum anstoanum]|nr:Uncharacterised protein [Candidatus Tiddalikarchaeum anstoanum]